MSSPLKNKTPSLDPNTDFSKDVLPVCLDPIKKGNNVGLQSKKMAIILELNPKNRKNKLLRPLHSSELEAQETWCGVRLLFFSV